MMLFTEKQKRIIEFCIKYGYRFPHRINGHDIELIKSLDIEDLEFIQQYNLYPVLLVYEDEDNVLALFNEVFSYMKEKTKNLFQELSHNIENIAVIQGFYNFNKYYGGNAFGLRTDIDLFSQKKDIAKIKAICHKHNFLPIGLDENLNAIEVESHELEAILENDRVAEKSFPLSYIGDYTSKAFDESKIPDAFFPLFKKDDSLKIFFGIEVTHKINEKINENFFVSNLENKNKYSYSLKTLSPEATCVLNLARIENSFQDGRVKIHPLIDTVAVFYSTSFDYEKFYNILQCLGSNDYIKTYENIRNLIDNNIKTYNDVILKRLLA